MEVEVRRGKLPGINRSDRGRGASPVSWSGKLKLVFWRNSVLNSNQREFVRGQRVGNGVWYKDRMRFDPKYGFIHSTRILGGWS